MKHNAALIANFKIADMIVQITMFGVMVWMFRYWFLFSMFLMAATQYISSLIWLLADRNVPKINGRKALSILFPLIGTLLIIAAVGNFKILEALIWPLLFVGPLLGIGYFLITVAEIRFYKRFTQQTFR